MENLVEIGCFISLYYWFSLTVLFQVSLLNENKPNQTEHASTMKEKSDINNVKTTRNKNIEKSIHKDKQNSVNLKAKHKRSKQ